MTDHRAAAALIGGVGLLERAISYTLGSLHAVTPSAMPNPTPCRDWDLRALLAHLNDSLLALHEAVDTGHVGLDVPPDGAAGDLVAAVRRRAGLLLGAWSAARSHGMVSIGGSPLTAGIVTSTGAIEIATHGWDVAQACGLRRPIPPRLAEELLELAPLLVTDADRPSRFAAPVEAPPPASLSDRLVAFLGRQPS